MALFENESIEDLNIEEDKNSYLDDPKKGIELIKSMLDRHKKIAEFDSFDEIISKSIFPIIAELKLTNELELYKMLVKADDKILEQVTKQLNKLVDVIKIKDITKNAVKRELCLIKVNIPNEKARAEIIQYVNIFRAKIVDVTEETLIVEITGDIEKNNAFISLLKSYGIKRISRTGLTAMARGV